MRPFLLLTFAALAPFLTHAADSPPKPAELVITPTAPLTVHVISGSKEYESETSLKPFLKDLTARYRVEVTASWGSDGGENLENLDALKSTDQMKLIRAYWEGGRPIVGIRTASHAFQEADNQIFDRHVLGGSHQSHWADEPVRATNRPEQTEHPVLRGVEPFVSRKLYKRADLLEDVVVLQTGDNGKDIQPVTLTRVHNGGRIFYTSLGVPEDFKEENFRRLIVNALFWTTHRDPERMAR